MLVNYASRSVDQTVPDVIGVVHLTALLREIFILLLGEALLVCISIDRITIERLWTETDLVFRNG